MRGRRLVALAMAAALAVSAMVTAAPAPALADGGNTTGGGSGSGSGNAFNMSWWTWQEPGDVWWKWAPSFSPATGDITSPSWAQHVMESNGKDAGYVNSVPAVAMAIFTDEPFSWQGHDFCAHVWDTDGYITWENPDNWVYDSWQTVPSALKDPSLTEVDGWSQYGPVIYNLGGQPVSSVYIHPERAYVPHDEYRTVTSIRRIYTNKQLTYRHPTGSQDDLRDIFFNPKYQDSYEHTTPPNATTDKYFVKVMTINVTEHHHWEENSLTHERRNESYTYSNTGGSTFEKTFNYNTKTPDITQAKYKPLNLNRNGYATSADIPGDWVNGAGIEAHVDNRQGITDNKALNALDNNSDTSFLFQIDNETLGLPSDLDWTTQPAALANGTYENVNRSRGYANDRQSSNSDDAFRYNAKLNMSLTTNTANPGIDSSSLLFGDDETTSSKVIQKRIDPAGVTFSGGDFSSRFTYVGDYYTDNGKDGSEYPRWWTDTYEMAKPYEYGTHFAGTITVNGINDPYQVDCGSGASAGSGQYNITVNANDKQRGLYVGIASQSCEQPVMTGHWLVKTLAGDLNS